MARPKRQADCHPDRPHDANGLCHNCYRNSRNALPEVKQQRADYYQENKELFAKKARLRWRELNPEVKREHGIQANAKRAAKPRVNKPKPVPVMPRETPVGFNDKDWWRVTDKPKQWEMGT